MPIVRPGFCHRVALAVDDAGVAYKWLHDVLGAAPVTGMETRNTRVVEGGDGADLEGTDSRMLWLGGVPFIVLAGGVPGGPVAKFFERYGPAVHSLAWEIDDMWTVEHLLRDRQIGIAAVNVAGRHFFMHPRDTHGVLMEWTDDTIGNDPRRPGYPDPGEGGGLVDVVGLAWVTAVVTDADATAAFLADLADAHLIEGNPRGPAALERTVDVAIGDITVRLVTPLSPESRYTAGLERGPRLWSYALRVPDLDAALAALATAGVSTTHREGAVAATDPADTLGVPMEWTY